MKRLALNWILNNKDKYKHWNKKNTSICKDCGITIYGIANMVMLKDDLWKKVSDNSKDTLCDCCIEKRIGREITIQDLKPHTSNEYNIIPCNAFWLQSKNKLKLLRNGILL